MRSLAPSPTSVRAAAGIALACAACSLLYPASDYDDGTGAAANGGGASGASGSGGSSGGSSGGTSGENGPPDGSPESSAGPIGDPGCDAGLSDCGAGSCRDLQNDGNNCGSCGHVCPNGKACGGGACPCGDVADDSDHHCCPPGMTFQNGSGLATPFCYSSVRTAATLTAAQASCKASFVISCAGAGGQSHENPQWDQAAVPAGAPCGYYLSGYQFNSPPSYTWISQVMSAGVSSGGACSAGCSTCTCGTCSCGFDPGCSQPFYCVSDPTGGPRVARCTADSDCQAGSACTSGRCSPSGKPTCSIDADCTGGKSCKPRVGFPAITGLCE